jgi:TatA/E family protein of Tat protein translocase
VSLGPAEILVIFVIALLVFGPNRLPEIGRQVGKGVRELRKFQQTLKADLDDVLADDMSDRAEPAPELPPKSTTAGPPPPAPEALAPAPVIDTESSESPPDVLDVSPPLPPPPAPT